MKDNLPVIGPKLSKDSTTNEGYIDADIVEYSENSAMELPCEKVQKRSNKESISGPKVNQKICSRNLHEKVTNNFVTNGKSESYNVSGLKVGVFHAAALWLFEQRNSLYRTNPVFGQPEMSKGSSSKQLRCFLRLFL